MTDQATSRLDLAGTRDFAVAGAGPSRRKRLAEFSRGWLEEIWGQATQGRPPAGVALAAVGSQGRGDAGPLSDYDLVLVHSGRTIDATDLAALANALWYPIWDAGVRLDHSVRSISQCRTVASGDLSAAVGLLDLSLIAGDAEVVAAARSTVAHDWRAGARKRLPDLVEALRARHIRHGDLAQSIEPDLKEAHGGLRDMTIIRALAAAWLTDRPHGTVDAAYQRLLDVRDALHVVTGRGRDRLGREDHDAVAALLGYSDSDDLLTDVSQAGRTLAYAVDATVRRASQSQRARVLRVGPRRPAMRTLGFGMFDSDGEVVLGAGRPTRPDPLLPLRAAVVAAQASLPIGPKTLENLAACPPLPQPWPELAGALFADLLSAGPGLVGVWEGLDQAGVIESWLPEWKAVRSRPQRNAVHRHTVDRHLLETVIYATGLVREVSRPDLLLLGALLHDIGKVSGARDHSLEGAPVAAAIATRMGLSDEDVEIIEFLVKEHLTLIELATRRDHSDPATVAAVSDAVGGRLDRFELLRALTEADAVAAGPKAWTDWRATLLDQLSAAVRHHLRDRPAPSAAPEEKETAMPVSEAMIRQLAGGEPVVRVVSSGGSFRLDIADRDRLGLFADTAGLLAAEGLAVRTAILRTVDGVAINEWHVEAPGGGEPEPERIGRGLGRLAQGDRAPLQLLDRRRSHAEKVAARAAGAAMPRALVIPGASAEATVLEVRSQDRPGLLHDLGMAFAKASVSVRSAHIATYAGQTLDTFYLTDLRGQVLAPAKVAEVVASIIDTCS